MSKKRIREETTEDKASRKKSKGKQKVVETVVEVAGEVEKEVSSAPVEGASVQTEAKGQAETGEGYESEDYFKTFAGELSDIELDYGENDM